MLLQGFPPTAKFFVEQRRRCCVAGRQWRIVSIGAEEFFCWPERLGEAGGGLYRAATFPIRYRKFLWRSNAHLFDDQARRDPPQPDRRHHTMSRGCRPARRGVEARLDEPAARPRGFYAVHKERPFFGELVESMIVRPDRRAGAGRRKRHPEEPRSDGRHQPGQRRRGHHPQAARRVDRRELGARLGRSRNRCAGNRSTGSADTEIVG